MFGQFHQRSKTLQLGRDQTEDSQLGKGFKSVCNLTQVLLPVLWKIPQHKTGQLSHTWVKAEHLDLLFPTHSCSSNLPKTNGALAQV